MTTRRNDHEDERMQDATGPETAQTAVGERKPFRPTWLLGTIAVVFGLFYAYDVWEAVGNWIGMAQGYAEFEQALPWAVYLASVATPFVVFVAALLMTRRRPIWQVAVALLVGLATVAVLALSLERLGLELYFSLFS